MVKVKNSILERVQHPGATQVPSHADSHKLKLGDSHQSNIRYDTQMTDPRMQPRVGITQKLFKRHKITMDGGLSHSRNNSKNKLSSVGAPRRRGDGGLIPSQKKGPFRDDNPLKHEPRSTFPSGSRS